MSAGRMVATGFRVEREVLEALDQMAEMFPRADGKSGNRSEVIRALLSAGDLVFNADTRARAEKLSLVLGVTWERVLRDALARGLQDLEKENGR